MISVKQHAVWTLDKSHEELFWSLFLCVYHLRIEKDNSPQNPYMLVSHNGVVSYDEDMRVVSTCHMDVHKFPFDTQECNISIGSAMYCGEGEMSIHP